MTSDLQSSRFIFVLSFGDMRYHDGAILPVKVRYSHRWSAGHEKRLKIFGMIAEPGGITIVLYCTVL